MAPGSLLLDAAAINRLSTAAVKQLDSIKPQVVEEPSWAADYFNALTARVR